MFGQLALGGDLVSATTGCGYSCNPRLTQAQHAGLNQFYDIPTISIRAPFLHDLLADVSLVQDWFNIQGGTERKPGDLSEYDLRHVGALRSAEEDIALVC